MVNLVLRFGVGRLLCFGLGGCVVGWVVAWICFVY